MSLSNTSDLPKILVTGGVGYVGSHTVCALAQAGYQSVVVDNFSNSHKDMLRHLRELVPHVRFHHADVCEPQPLNDILAKEKPVGVIHFAAHKSVPESVSEPVKYYHNNVASLSNLLRVVREYEMSIPFLFSSSCAVYGEKAQVPVDERMCWEKPSSPYAQTKQIGETLLHDLARSGQTTRTVALRYFNPIGAHDSGKIGEYPLGVPQNVVPLITQVAARHRKELVVFGADYDTPDGTCCRDYVHVMDIAEAHIQSLTWLMKQPAPCHEVFNCGTGKSTSVKELIQLFESANQVQVPRTLGAKRPGDVPIVYADTQKIRRVVGWKAKRTIEEALKSAWRWQQNLDTG